MTEFKDEQYVTFDTVESLRNKRKAILSFHTVVEENRLLNELISDLLTALKAAKCALDAPRDSMIFNMAKIAIEKAIEKAEKREIEQGSKCSHEGYSFKEQGRCCPQCGEFLTDFGD